MVSLIILSLLFLDVPVPTGSHRVILIDLNKMTWIAYRDGQEIRKGRAVGGRTRCLENPQRSCKTPSGSFIIYAKYGPQYRSGRYPIDCSNRKICGARMPFFMPFHRAGIGLHGSDMMVDSNQSHGCVRLFPKDAEWLSKQFLQIGDQVIVLPYEN